ncbi:MAG TPA: AsmA-like C-terminal region-containing protein, partial [Hyphomicrobiaceae bacterium]|nr:AsmA-like C-terminal region-containing protein [Hyphomicrobiaceae bacterium]
DASVTVERISASGALTIDTRGARPFVRGSVRMADLDLNAIQAIVGSGVPASAAAGATPAPQRSEAGPQSIEDLLKPEPQKAAPTTQSGRTPQVRGYTRRKGWSDDPIKVEGLKAVDTEVQIGFQRLVWKDMTTGAGQVSVGLRDGNGRFTLDDLAIYDGRARGVVTVTGGDGGNVVFGTNMVAEGVSVLPLLKSLSGFDWLSGRARIAIAAAGQGLTERQIVSSLNGKTELTMGDGAIQGINVGSVIRGVMQGRLGNFDRVPTEKTDFSELAGTMQIVNGVGRNSDFRLKSPILSATGAGTINLPAESIDYLMKAKIVGAVPGQDLAVNLTGLEVPLKISGPLEKPTVTPDLSGLLRDPNQAAKAVQEALKSPKGRELEQTVRGALSGDPEAKAKAKSLLNQFLGKQQ